MSARLAIAALIAALIPADAAANPLDAFGFGARATAMGGAQTAASDDVGAIYYNPAILARFAVVQADAGYQIALPTLLIDGRDVGNDTARGTTGGLAIPARIGPAELALAAAFYIPDQHLMRLRSLPANQPRFVMYDNRPQRLFLATALSARLGSRVAVGIGYGFFADTLGGVSLDGRVGFPNAEDSDLSLGLDVDLREIRYLHTGAVVTVTDWLEVGASYRGGFTMVLDQDLAITGDIGASGREPIVEDALVRLRSISLDYFQPQEFTAGASARISPQLLVALDVGYHRWSKFVNPAARLETEIDAGEFNDLLDIPPSEPLDEADFHDIVVPRLGVEWQLSQSARRALFVRGGYSFEPSPAPQQQGSLNLIDNDKHTGALGAGVTIAQLSRYLLEPVSFDAAFALTYLAERGHHKLSPVDPVGDYRSSGRVWQFAVNSRWRF